MLHDLMRTLATAERDPCNVVLCGSTRMRTREHLRLSHALPPEPSLRQKLENLVCKTRQLLVPKVWVNRQGFG